jgi:hypothetical protein
MDRYYQVLGNREMGTQVPVSIATALALESAMGLSEDHPEHKQKPPLQSVDALWVNLRTLIRNIMGAIPTQDQDKVFPDPLLDALTAELRIIASAVQLNTQRRCKLVPYVQSYKSIPSKYRNCFLRELKTEKQKFGAALEKSVLDRLHEMHLDMTVIESDLKLPQNPDDALIITHMPIDLLSRYEFSRLRLLESHTGKIKAYTSWNSKLTGGKELSRMPFNHVTLQFFGDGVHFNTFPMKEKKQIIELADRRRWNPTTTLDKMRMDINSEPLHPTFKSILLSMF